MIAPVRLPLRVAPRYRQAVTAPQQAETIWLVRMFRRISQHFRSSGAVRHYDEAAREARTEEGR
jgi:hypothetical protein